MYASQQYSPSWKVPKLVSLKVLRNVVLKANSEILVIIFSLKVREAYFKWWKIKHSQSEFLSKHCPAKEMNTSVSVLIAKTIARFLLHWYMHNVHIHLHFSTHMHFVCELLSIILTYVYVRMHPCITSVSMQSIRGIHDTHIII